jgi:HK97 family phage prohead protease
MRALFVLKIMKVKKILIDGKEIAVVQASAKAEFKAVEGGEGIVEAYVSIFGNVDAAGEIVEKGAFSESLARKLPKVVWSHNWDEIIGKTLEAREDDRGLYTKFQLVLGVQKGSEAYELMKAGATDEFSIGYSVDESFVDEKGIRHLTKLTLYEISPVLAGCNPDTEILSVKSAEVKDDE